MNDSIDFQDAESARSGQSHVANQPVSFPPHHKLADGKTAYEQTRGEKFDGLMIPCGAEVCYKPISSKDESRVHQFVKNVLAGKFVGYDLHAGEDGQVIACFK